jgi:hypothetical protein
MLELNIPKIMLKYNGISTSSGENEDTPVVNYGCWFKIYPLLSLPTNPATSLIVELPVHFFVLSIFEWL